MDERDRKWKNVPRGGERSRDGGFEVVFKNII